MYLDHVFEVYFKMKINKVKEYLKAKFFSKESKLKENGPEKRTKIQKEKKKSVRELSRILTSLQMNFQHNTNTAKHEDVHPRARGPVPRVMIYECCFRNCPKRFHKNITSFKSHFTNHHVKSRIEHCVSEAQRDQEIQDSRECPFEPCGYYAPFRGALLSHVTINHDILEFTVEMLAREEGVHQQFLDLKNQNVFDLQLSEKSLQLSSCSLCDQEVREMYLSTHVILKHYLDDYMNVLSVFPTWRRGHCPAFNCNVRSCLDKIQSLTQIYNFSSKWTALTESR